ncbi:hypothetical protein H6P81_014806 [Aristolochia fimbriata]|uniref:Uncharacterized protein n=1 Tax=Aristolochia fimbriata TaxID=158543 RepID=A0AAV7E4Y7_ARIFI|nr:hypothetical protein H6P81_014806 [Aristolochia fimbriata]
MYAAWLLFKDNMNCSHLRGGCSEALRPEKVPKDRKGGDPKANQARDVYCAEGEHTPGYENEHRPERFRELEAGNISRNIIEIIFRTTSVWKRVKKIERVLKVTKLPEVLERFEEYREKVKKHARSNSRRHTRSVVDGNELLSFYVTTMSCCASKADKVTQLCCNPACGVCSIIRFGFRDEAAKVRNRRLSAIGNSHCKDAGRKREVEKAVVLCRVIAGSSSTVADAAEGGSKMGLSDSHVYSEGLSVKNSDGILPCFVIIYS